MKAVSYRWGKLTKEQKGPFDAIANEDKRRYDKELSQFKKGSFNGRQLNMNSKH